MELLRRLQVQPQKTILQELETECMTMWSLRYVTNLIQRQFILAHVSVAAGNNSIRCVHSKTQIKRLFKNPAKRRIDSRMGIEQSFREPDQRSFEPVFKEVNILTNGWSAPPSPDFELPQYPFSVSRTKNKPFDAIGFLPVYSKFRYGFILADAFLLSLNFVSSVLCTVATISRRKDGTKATTRVRKVSGNVEVFLRELRSVLGIPPPLPGKNLDDPVRVRTGGTIEVQGNRVREIKDWLAGLGF